MMENVTKRLLVAQVDGSELESILLDHFKSSSWGANKLATYYPNEETPKLVVHYSKGGDKIRLIETSLNHQDVSKLAEKIRSILLGEVKSLWVDKIFFTSKPIRGVWKCELFSIREAILSVPPEGRELIGYPAIIEYEIQYTGNWWIDNLREERAFKEYIQVLSLFIPYVINSEFEDQLGLVRGVKVFSSQEDKETFYNREVTQLEHGYGIENMERNRAKRISFKAVTIPYLDDKVLLSGDDTEIEELYIPRSLDTWLRKYKYLDIDNKKLLLRASYWTSFARKVYKQSKSGALVACVQSIETLIPRSNELEKQFILFLETYSAIDIKIKRLLYDKRSTITHGSALLIMDEEIRMITRPSIHADYELIWQAMRVCREAVIGWYNSLQTIREEEA